MHPSQPDQTGPATWTTNLSNGEVHSSDARACMLGYEPSEAQPRIDWWDALLHPDDIQAVRAARARHYKGVDAGYRSEYRARRRDGSWAWLLEVGSVSVRTSGGAPLRAAGILLDISLEREVQLQVQLRLERLRTVFDYTLGGCALLESGGTVIETNNSSLKRAHTTLDKVVGQPFWDTAFFADFSPEQREQVRAGVLQSARGERVRMLLGFKSPAGAKGHVDLSLCPVIDDDGNVVALVSESRDITPIIEAQEELHRAESRLALATGCANIGLWDVDLAAGTAWYSDTWWTMLGYTPNELPAEWPAPTALVHPDDLPHTLAVVARHRCGDIKEFVIEHRMRAKDGSWRWIHVVGHAVERDAQGHVLRIAGIHLDVTARKEAESRLAAAERLEAVGMLAAGVAHEINTPIQFVSDSVYFIKDSVTELLALIGKLNGLLQAHPESAAAAAELQADLPYLAENLPKALDRSTEGLLRVAQIVHSMRHLAHSDRPEMSPVDLNHLIESALVVAHTEYKSVADVKTELAPLPMIRCHAGEISQVLLNLIVNASHATADANRGTDGRGLITITTRLERDGVELCVSDTGAGIPSAVRHRIFEPFFTTKEVGRGTGQGLSITRDIVVKHHGGSIDFDTEVGRGTTFRVRLLLDPGSAA